MSQPQGCSTGTIVAARLDGAHGPRPQGRSAIKDLLLRDDPAFWARLDEQTRHETAFPGLIALSALRRKAVGRGLQRPTSATRGKPLRLAVVGGYSLYPLHELLTHLLDAAGVASELFLGDYDNDAAEIMEPDGALEAFRPEVTLLLPGARRCKYDGSITDPREAVQAAASATATQLLELCGTLHDRTAADVILGNFMLPARRDLGEFRTRTLASDWSFRKWVNLELGLNAPPYVRILDLEFLANRHGGLAAEDPRGWFESKQPCAPALLVELCRDAARLIAQRRQPPKKVLVLDLDNTLWGGVVADDGLEGIEIGDTSPRGEAFKAFQRAVAALKERGVLLGVCSKNDRARALEPFEQHPEMVLRAGDFVAFHANWEPKSDNLRRIAEELNLGLDSFVFVDDNPAEIEIVRQFAPAVSTILLGDDPAEYAGQLQDCGYFEPTSITLEDRERTGQYRAEAERQTLLASAADMNAYLQSLAMQAVVCEFTPVDVPRLAQLINKSNQFNLTTRRRTESEVQALIGDPDYLAFSVRLQDRFGDHGLISIAIGRVSGPGLTLEVDTWLMSCRVLKRQVEDLVLNELCGRARARGRARIVGVYLPTSKNEMVRAHFPRLGFQAQTVTPERAEYVLDLESFQPRPTRIQLRSLA
jgi:FkbH-like protein